MLSWLGKLLRGGSAPPPADLDALLREALAHEAAGRAAAAESCYYRALALAPGEPAVHLRLGDLHRREGRPEAALYCCQEAVRLAPGLAPARNNLGNAHRDLGDVAAAEAEYRRALALDANLAEAHYNLAIVLQRQGREDEALAGYHAARQARPDFALAHLNAGYLLEARPDAAGAINAYRAALAADPGLVEAHVNLGMQLLLTGRFAEGWAEYEWRLRYAEYSGADLAGLGARWRGEPLGGRTILLDAEQGFGDALQFLRYAPLVAARGGRVLVRCAPELAALAADVEGVAGVVGRGTPLPAFDLYCPLPSLPYVFGTALESIPASVPYLAADAGKAARWRARFDADGGAIRVGLVWASQSAHRTAAAKSAGFEALAALGDVPGVRLYSLQKGAAAADVQADARVVDLSRDLGDFSDTAAAVAGLDLVVSVDTAVAHLAGAMGKPVWTLLLAAPDWRWLLEREDCPWYPTMRLFRQQRRGDWRAPAGEVAEALRAFAGARAGAG